MPNKKYTKEEKANVLELWLKKNRPDFNTSDLAKVKGENIVASLKAVQKEKFEERKGKQ